MDATLPEPIAALSEALFRRRVKISIVISDIQQGRWASGLFVGMSVSAEQEEYMRHVPLKSKVGWVGGRTCSCWTARATWQGGLEVHQGVGFSGELLIEL